MIALLGAVLMIGLTASCLAALLRLQGTVAFVLGAGLLAFAEVVAVSHAVSVFDAYERGWFLAALAVLAGGVVTATAAVRPPWPSLRRDAALRELRGDPLVVVLAIVVLVELGYLFALALFTAPNEYDVVTYHLTRAVFWIQQESVGFVPDATDARINDFPPNAEIAQGATMLLSGSIRWVGLVQLAALVATATAIYGIASRIGLDRRGAAFGALAFATLPVVALQAPSALNDLVVAALIATTTYFALGRGRGELVLAGVSLALLVGTKGTAVLALPSLLALILLDHRGRRLAGSLIAGVLGVAVGVAWYVANVVRGESLAGSAGDLEAAVVDVPAIVARLSRYAVETLELPGASGRDRYLYLVAACLVAAVGLAVTRRRSLVLLAAALTALPVVVPTFERWLHSAYYNGWQLVGYDEATGWGIIRDSTLASSLQSWYGPVGLALALAATALVVRAARRGALPWTAVVLAVSPFAFLLGSAAATGYHPFSGRYIMGSVALSAATWGVVRSSTAVSWAVVATATTTTVLSLVNFAERPAGVDLLEGTDRPSIWELPREWSQSIQPEVSHVIGYVDGHAPTGSTIAVTRAKEVYPFAYVGYPRIEHRLAYADTLEEATKQHADWAVLPLTAGCASGWRLELRSPPWAVYRHVPGTTCR